MTPVVPQQEVLAALVEVELGQQTNEIVGKQPQHLALPILAAAAAVLLSTEQQQRVRAAPVSSSFAT
jgi:hypothetical protein